MWRRVPCEQPLHTGQSILSPRRKPMQMVVGCRESKGLARQFRSRRRKKGEKNSLAGLRPRRDASDLHSLAPSPLHSVVKSSSSRSRTEAFYRPVGRAPTIPPRAGRSLALGPEQSP